MKNALRFLMVSVLLLVSTTVFAQSGGPYGLTGTGVATGAGAIIGGAYSLTNVIGQPEVGVGQVGGGYSLTGGVVDADASGSQAAGDQRVFLPLVHR